ncbi:MAG: recombinase RecJ [Thermoplasmatales archaeon SG8-52-3]|nr:MAG: recombinase RecJ [Thermoplasmatales archaeon SG8-52-3]
MLKRAEKIGKIINSSKEIHIVSHIDADGITAGTIAYQTLKRLDKQCSIEFVKDLDNENLEKLKNDNHELVWFTDLGSSISTDFQDINKIITDHHACSEDSNKPFHLNPHLFGLDGTFEISGAGVTYLVSRAIDKKNIDLSPLAIVGACGDLQDRRYRKLKGMNREILSDGESINAVKAKIDIRFFGRESRPIFKMLQFASDPIIPGLTGREQACVGFLQELGITMKDGDSWRKWTDLCKDERRLIISSIAQLLLTKGFGHKITERIIGEVYILCNEQEGTEIHDAKEFATLLNSTARYGKCEVGLKVCLGNRDKWLAKARNLLLGHRQNLVVGLQFAKEEGIIKRKHLQFFHAGNGIRDTIVGIVANMLLNSEDVSSDLPLVGFANKGNGEVKVSARGTEELVEKGLNLSQAMKKAASALDSIGGGHDIAAGATIPQGTEEEFLDLLEKEIKTQLYSSSKADVL